MSAYSSAHASPPGRDGRRAAPAPVGAPTAFSAPARGRAEASRVPLLVGAGAVLLSVVLAVLVLVLLSAPAQLFSGVSLPLVSSDSWALSLLGYLLTPLVVILAYGWDVAWQRQARADNRNVVLHPGYTRVLKWLMIAGIVLGAWHVLNLAVPLAEAWGLA
ncbi:MAG: hypothetical protein GX871_07500 [Microbacteriaceae bacterium]|nr:hypothetical protein [Microbacteriaceae bacterium]HOA86865.1 hypothetical protein [Microbacteriaceae bacterium]HPZ34306.1 hypothetical protein [Microbacteriaceae bacterium]HQC92332.1 hypothetical protein [Microbacteriaceae bacterium]